MQVMPSVCDPGGHATHGTSGPGENLPAGQRLHSVAPRPIAATAAPPPPLLLLLLLLLLLWEPLAKSKGAMTIPDNSTR